MTAIHADPGPLADALVAHGTTLTHGDLWLVNAALQPDRTVLIDWGLATEAPGAVDFATFLMGASAVDASRDDLLDDVRRIHGSQHDEIALRLALLAAVADLGWNKALDATEHSDPSIRDRGPPNCPGGFKRLGAGSTPACADIAIPSVRRGRPD